MLVTQFPQVGGYHAPILRWGDWGPAKPTVTPARTSRKQERWGSGPGQTTWVSAHTEATVSAIWRCRASSQNILILNLCPIGEEYIFLVRTGDPGA